jgi:hypothetical protein
MPTFKSFSEYAQAIQKMEKEIDDNTSTIARDMGQRAQDIAASAADADIGGSFSGWRRSKPIELATKLKKIKNGVVLTPTRASAGPWTVAERGRNNGNASGFSGPGINRKTGATARTKSGGIRKVRAATGKRWNGHTDGRNAHGDTGRSRDGARP